MLVPGEWNAISQTGALGVMQLTVDNYLKGYNANFNPFDEKKSIKYGAQLLSGFIKKFGSDSEGMKKVLVAYNQGEGSVSRAIKNNNEKWMVYIKSEGKNYVRNVNDILHNNKKIPGYFGGSY